MMSCFRRLSRWTGGQQCAHFTGSMRASLRTADELRSEIDVDVLLVRIGILHVPVDHPAHALLRVRALLLRVRGNRAPRCSVSDRGVGAVGEQLTTVELGTQEIGPILFEPSDAALP
jgi:hypothetical protein